MHIEYVFIAHITSTFDMQVALEIEVETCRKSRSPRGAGRRFRAFGKLFEYRCIITWAVLTAIEYC
jgi:hypothetical protein